MSRVPAGAATTVTSSRAFSRPKAFPGLALVAYPTSGASQRIRSRSFGPPPELLRLFEQAFSGGLGLGFNYTDREGRASSRRIEPHGLLVEPPVWYVLARDVEKGEPRMFRMDRIARPKLLPEIVFRPDVRILEAQLCDHERWRPLTGSWTPQLLRHAVAEHRDANGRSDRA